MDDLSLKSAKTEEARIRAVYANRPKYDVRYSCFSPGNLFILQECERRFLALLKRCDFAPLDKKKILEIGCGSGYWLREFIKWGARPENIVGVDLLSHRVAEAKKLCPEAVQVQCGSAADLAFPNATFDLVLQSLGIHRVVTRGGTASERQVQRSRDQPLGIVGNRVI